jgi:hypothetical protein
LQSIAKVILQYGPIKRELSPRPSHLRRTEGACRLEELLDVTLPLTYKHKNVSQIVLNGRAAYF